MNVTLGQVDEDERLAIPAGTVGAAAMTPGPGSQAG